MNTIAVTECTNRYCWNSHRGGYGHLFKRPKHDSSIGNSWWAGPLQAHQKLYYNKKAFQSKANHPLASRYWGGGKGSPSEQVWTGPRGRAGARWVQCDQSHGNFCEQQNDRQTDTAENITFPHNIRMRAVIKIKGFVERSFNLSFTSEITAFQNNWTEHETLKYCWVLTQDDAEHCSKVRILK